MIQLNLLPDVKLEYIKAQRLKHFVVTLSVIAAAAALFIFVLLLLTVDVWQKKTISDLSGDIKTESTKLQNTPNLNKILTIQSQLNSLDSLHDQKPVVSRLPGFIAQVTPTSATISNLEVDYSANTMSITGNAGSLDVVNVFTDALKFTNYTTSADPSQKKAFSDVVLSAFTRDSTTTSYTITLSFDPTIFADVDDSKDNDIINDVTLVVPNIVSTRSIIEKPGALFKGEN